MKEYPVDVAIALFALSWFYGIAWFITRGWRDVSKRYKFKGIYTGRRYYFRSGSFAGANFGCFLVLGANRQGAYFSTIMPEHLCPYISRSMADRFERLSEGRWTYKHATERVFLGKDEYR